MINTQSILKPLSGPQLNVWYHQKLSKDTAAYNVGNYFTLSDIHHPENYDRAWTWLVQNCSIFRSTFTEIDGEPFMATDVAHEVKMDCVSASLTNEMELEDALAEIKSQSFDLMNGPVYRAGRLHLGGQRWCFYYVIHHLCVDGASAVIINQTLQNLMVAWAEDQNFVPDFVFGDPDVALPKRASEDYWRTKISDFGTPISLSHKTNKVALVEVPGQCSVNLNRYEYTKLAEISRVHSGGVLALFAVAFGLYVTYQTNSKKACIGFPSSGRNRRSRIIGMMSNVLPLFVNHDKTKSFAEMLIIAGQDIRASLRHARYPTHKINGLYRKQSTENLFSGLVSLQIFNQSFKFGKNNSICKTMSSGPAEQINIQIFDLMDNNDVVIRFEYNRQLFQQKEAELHLKRFVDLIRILSKDPDIPLAQLPLLGPEDRAFVLSRCSGDIIDHGGVDHLSRLFHDQMLRTPDAIALIHEDIELSFIALDKLSNQMAHMLQARGVGLEDRVAILLPRGFSNIIAMLGVLKCGAAYVPLDPEMPPARLNYSLEDASPALLIDQGLVGLDDYLGDHILIDDNYTTLLRDYPDTELVIEGLDADQLAYVIYTSGSTGQPKGAGNSHAALINRLLWKQSILKLDNTDRILQKTALTFDVAVWEWFLPLMTGAALVVISPDGHKDPDYLAEMINRYRVTTLHFVPSMLEVFLEVTSSSYFESLKHIVTSGEALSGAIQARVHKQLSNAKLWNLYGPTEAAIDVSAWLCRPEDGTILPPIGFPIWNTELYVLDASLEPVPDGVVGELYISGSGLARGYHGRGGLTAESFIADPFKADDALKMGSRMYRTGDLALRREDGALCYLGRADDQVKIRGFRIEPGEIEAQSLALFGDIFAQVAVVVREMGGQSHLIAYGVVREGEVLPDQTSYQRDLGAVLPDYMVPSALIEVATLPLSSNGKLDRRALPAPVFEMQDGEAPANDDEARLCQLFAELTGRETVGPTENFFTIGGHSLLAIRLMSRLQDNLGRVPPLRLVFQHSTPRNLAQALNGSYDDQRLEVNPGQGVIQGRRRILSEGQKRLWLLTTLEGYDRAYNMPGAFKLSEKPVKTALNTALRELILRHEALQMQIQLDADGHLEGLIADVPDQILEWQKIDNMEVDSAFKIEAGKPFDLGYDLPIRASVLETKTGNYYLTLTLHHHAADERSVQILIEELGHLYQCACDGSKVDLPDLPFTYSDWAAVVAEESKSETYSTLLNERVQKIKSYPSQINLPAKNIDGVSTAGYYKVATNPSLSSCVFDLTEKLAVSRFSIYFAAYSMLMSKLGGAEDVLLGLPVSTRNKISLMGEKLVSEMPVFGYFLNTQPVPIAVKPNQTVLEFIKKCNLEIIDAEAASMIPFDQYVNHLHSGRNAVDMPLIQALITYQHGLQTHKKLGKIDINSLVVEPETCKFPIILHVNEDSNNIAEFTIEYDQLRFEESHIKTFSNFLHETIKSFSTFNKMLCQVNNRQIAGLSITKTKISKKYMIDEHNNKMLIPDLFLRQHQASPDTSAIIEGDKVLSYDDLFNRVKSIVKHLALTVGQNEASIIIAMPRSSDMIAAIMACGYLGALATPLDISIPAKRFRYIVRDSGSKIILLGKESPVEFRNIALAEGAVVINVNEINLEISETLSLSSNRPSGDELIYLLYTSGSTGKPKGVSFKHSAMANLVHWKCKELPNEKAVVLQYSSIGFDAALQEIYTSLSKGDTLVLVDEMMRVDPQLLLGHMALHKVDHVYMPFVGLSMLADFADQNNSIYWPKSIFTAGEQLVATDSIKRVYQAHPSARLYNFYGPTETHVVTNLALDQDPIKWEKLPTIGLPIADTSVYVLDQTLFPVPVGGIGELYISGASLARGYYNKPGLTAERFIADPISLTGERMYRTGDIVRMRPNGEIEFHGRQDSQLKIRGFRVETAEIELGFLEESSDITAIAVVAHKIGDEKRLIAYMSLKNHNNFDERDIRKTAIEKFPDYMRPFAYVVLENLPQTSSGKIDRIKLTESDLSSVNSGSIYEPPRNDMERIVCLAVEKILGLSSIGIRDNFFALGGSSLDAIRLLMAINKIGEKNIGIADIFRTPVIEDLANTLTTKAQEPNLKLSLVKGLGGIIDD